MDGIETTVIVSLADGTRDHLQEPDRKHNDVNIIPGCVTNDLKVQPSVLVNKSYKFQSDIIGDNEILAKNAVIISDGEPEHNVSICRWRHFSSRLTYPMDSCY